MMNQKRQHICHKQMGQPDDCRTLSLSYDPNANIGRTILDLVNLAREAGLEELVVTHLVGAKLRVRFPACQVENGEPRAAHGPRRSHVGLYKIGSVRFHVSTQPNRSVVRACKKDLARKVYPVLVVIPEKLLTAKVFAEELGIQNQLTVFALDEFIAANILQMSSERSKRSFEIFDSVIDEYNRRVEKLESGCAPRIILCRTRSV
ncbi:MAG TPA: DUF4928 family protein [Terriglobia bacterium]|nr:DUF4928 family protein [Terriglobia bacterium]